MIEECKAPHFIQFWLSPIARQHQLRRLTKNVSSWMTRKLFTLKFAIADENKIYCYNLLYLLQTTCITLLVINPIFQINKITSYITIYEVC